MSRVLAASTIAALLGVSLILYTAPPEPHRFGMAVEGAAPFRELYGLEWVPARLSPTSFVWSFRSLVAVAWISWALLVVAEFRQQRWSTRLVMRVVTLTALAVAVLAPPVLSNDVYAYVAYGRLPFRYGLNPYIFDRPALQMADDPAAAFLIWGTPLAYGPLWTLMAACVATVGNIGGLVPEVLTHKLVAAASLVVAAAAGGHLAERREPGRGPLTTLAIGLNPLIVLEGAGSGHNDLTMMALVAGGAAIGATHPKLGALLVGLAAAVKATAAALLPLIAVAALRGAGRRRWRNALVLTAIVGVPTVLLSFLFGGPSVLWQALAVQVTAGHQMARLTAGRVLIVPALLWGAYLTWTAKPTHGSAWLTGWIPVALVLAIMMSPVAFPWYLTWALLPALTAWNERHRLFTVATATLGFLFTWMYVVAPHLPGSR